MKQKVFMSISVKLLSSMNKYCNAVKFWNVSWSKNVNWLEDKSKRFKLNKLLRNLYRYRKCQLSSNKEQEI